MVCQEKCFDGHDGLKNGLQVEVKNHFVHENQGRPKWRSEI